MVSDFSARLAASRGRFVGITTETSKGGITKYNGQVVSQSDSYITVRDRNRKANFKLAKSTIVGVSGI